jgi:hypothetical protein
MKYKRKHNAFYMIKPPCLSCKIKFSCLAFKNKSQVGLGLLNYTRMLVLFKKGQACLGLEV